jgi:ribosomal protein S18 acetylase RimI-like enzyme
MSVAVEDAKAVGAQSVWLGVNQHNERANRFYERNGFVVVGERKFQVGDSLEEDFVRELVL